MANQCYNYLTLYGEKNQIDEFVKVISYRDRYEEINPMSPYIDCSGALVRSKESTNKEMRDFFKDEISNNKIIGYEMEVDDGQIYYKTDWSPYVEPLLYISNLFPNMGFELFYEEPDSQFEGWYEFRDGHLLTDFSISKEDSGWSIDIRKSKFKTEDGFKNHYRSQLSGRRRLKFNFCE